MLYLVILSICIHIVEQFHLTIILLYCFVTAMFLDFNVSTYTFNESDAAVSNIIEVRKRVPSLETEVDIPIQVLALSGTADIGTIQQKGVAILMYACI